MLGAIVGDIVGSIFEWDNKKTTKFPLFSPKCHYTDDTILTIALADAILHNKSYGKTMKEYYKRYPNSSLATNPSYGSRFSKWAESANELPYQSWGNGAAMRISPAAWANHTLPEVLEKAEEYTVITHDHSEGIKGAQATAAAIFLARAGHSKEAIVKQITQLFGYDLTRTCDDIRPAYSFKTSCQETVPEAIAAFLDSTDFESAVRLAVSLGGDSDTLACIAGSIAEAFYGIPQTIALRAFSILDDPLRKTTIEFLEKYKTGDIHE